MGSRSWLALAMIATGACADGTISESRGSSATIGQDETGGSTTSDVVTSGISAANASMSRGGSDGTDAGCVADEGCPDSDGDPCTWPTCSDGTCVEVTVECGGPTHVCSIWSCDRSTGECLYTPDDAPCSPDECQVGTCILVNDADGLVVGSTCDSTPVTGADCDDDDPCTMDDECQSGICVGAALSCDIPPDSSCEGATLHRFGAPGVCADGTCDFEQDDVTCPEGCQSAQCIAPNHPVISELLYDDPDSDNDVWIELWAPPGSSLTGYTLEFVNGNGGTVADSLALSGTTPSNGIVVIVDPSARDQDLASKADIVDSIADLQNGPDSLRIVDAVGTVDAVGYGDFASAVFAGEGSPAPDASGTESLARLLSYVDTDDNGADFRLEQVPTPGEVNG